MNVLLFLFVLLELFALALLWFFRAPNRVLYVFVVLAFVPLGMGRMLGQTLPAAYLLIPGATLVYLVDRFRPSRRPEPARSGRNWIWLLAILFFATVFLHFFRNPILIGDMGSVGKSPAGIHGWMAILLSTCYFVVFSGATFRAPASAARALRLGVWLCLGLTVFGIALVHVTPLRDVFDRALEAGLFREHFYGTGGSDGLRPRFRDPSGGYRIGTLGPAACVAMVGVLASRVSTPVKLLAALFCIGGVLQSGARAEFVGASVALIAWPVLTRNLRLTLALSAVAGVVLIYVFAVSSDVSPLVHRTTTLATGEGFEHEPRVILFRKYIESIEQHPWIGVGIGEAEAFPPGDPLVAFIHSNLRFGGHGTYISILYLFGLAGLLTFLALLSLSLGSAYRLFRSAVPPRIRSLALFALLFLLYYLFPMGIAGNGTSRILFAVFGLVSGLVARDWARHTSESEGPVPIGTDEVAVGT